MGAGLGAHHIVHHHDLGQVRAVAPDGVDFILSPHTAGIIETFAELLRPGGQITAIDEPDGLDILPLKEKSISFHWEFMFTRPLFRRRHDRPTRAADRIADLVDAGQVRTTLTAELGPINAATLRQAHEMLENGRTIGKVVVAGF